MKLVVSYTAEFCRSIRKSNPETCKIVEQQTTRQIVRRNSNAPSISLLQRARHSGHAVHNHNVATGAGRGREGG